MPAPADSLQILLQSVCHSQRASPWQTVVTVKQPLHYPGARADRLTGQEHTPPSLPGLSTATGAPSPPSGNSWRAAIPAFWPGRCTIALYDKCRLTLSWSGISQVTQKQKEQRFSARSPRWAWLLSLSPGGLTTTWHWLCCVFSSCSTRPNFQFPCMQLTQLFLTPKFRKHLVAMPFIALPVQEHNLLWAFFYRWQAKRIGMYSEITTWNMDFINFGKI